MEYPTSRPCPHVEGVYSLNAVSNTDCRPDLTFFREDLNDLLDVKHSLVKERRFSMFILRHSKTRYSVYDASGAPLTTQEIQELDRPAPLIDQPNPYPSEEQRPSGILKLLPTELRDRRQLAVMPGHAGASAEIRVHFWKVLDELVEAGDIELRHVMVAENNLLPYRCYQLLASPDLGQERIVELSLHTQPSDSQIELERTRMLTRSRLTYLAGSIAKLMKHHFPNFREDLAMLTMVSIPLDARDEIARQLSAHTHEFWYYEEGSGDLLPDDFFELTDLSVFAKQVAALLPAQVLG